MAAAKLARGSRSVVVLSAIRQPNTEINCGTGKEVGSQGIADAGAPLHIRWPGSSEINIPVSR